MMKRMLAIGVFAAAAAVTLHGGESVKIAVSPAYAIAPANLRVRVRLEPSAENRTLEIVADGETFYRSSEIDLQGERAPATLEFAFRNVPGGSYQVSAVLKGQGGRQRAKAITNVTILSGLGDVPSGRD